MHFKTPRIVGLALLALPVIAFAATTTPTAVDAIFRECMRSSYQTLDESELQGYRTYNNAVEFSLQKRLDDRQRAWNVSNAADRQSVLSNIEKIFKQEVTDAKTVLNDKVKNAKTDAKNLQADCKASFVTNYKKDKRCLTSAECSSSQICTTERTGGACDRLCGPNGLCMDGCAGYCEKK